MRRSEIASSTWSHHMSEMLSKRSQFFVRGYSDKPLTRKLGLQLSQSQIRKEKKAFRQLRRIRLQPKAAADGTDRVLALKLPYTCRTTSLQKHLKITKLQQHIENNCPALSRASLGRFVIANLKTNNVRDIAKYRSPIAE